MASVYILCSIVYFLAQGAAGIQQIHLLDALGLNRSTVSDFTDVTPAKNVLKGQSAYFFGGMTADLKVNLETYNLFQEEFHGNSDVTFAFTFKLHKNATGRAGTLISVTSPATLRKHLVLTLELLEDDPMAIEGQTKKIYEASLVLEYDSNGRTVEERIVLGKNSTMRHWVSGMFRLKNRNEVIVYMNCRPIAKKMLQYPISNIPSDGELRVTQTCEADFWTGGMQIAKRLLATLNRADILFGSLAFQLKSNCINRNKVEETSKSGQDESPSGQPPAPSGLKGVQKSTCFYAGMTYKNGENWGPKKCQNCTCQSGKVICRNSCRRCSYGSTIYRHGKMFYLPDNACKRCTCKNGVINCSTITCPKLFCRFGTHDGKGCCPMCRETKCAQEGKIFGLGCKRSCDSDYNAPCGKRRMGCYCPKGSVENKEGKCVKPSDCTCTVDDGGNMKTFKANTVVAINKCRYCACTHGQVQCLAYC